MFCSRCKQEAARLIPSYFGPKLCPACCVWFADTADAKQAWPDASLSRQTGPPFYQLDENLDLHERVIAPGRAIAVCDTCGDDFTTLIANTDSRCIMTSGCKGRRRAGAAYEKAPRRKRGTATPRTPKPELEPGHYPCPQCDAPHDARTESGMPILCSACRDYTAVYGKQFISGQP